MALKFEYMSEEKKTPIQIIERDNPVRTSYKEFNRQPVGREAKLLKPSLWQRLKYKVQSIRKKIAPSELDKWTVKVPEINWNANPNPPSPAMNVDTDPLASSADVNLVSEYTHTYATFSGCDTVVSFNGKIVGALQAFEYEVDDEMKGEVKLTCTQFTKHCLQTDDTLAVVTMVNEYGQAAYQVFRINKLKKYYTGTSMDNVCSSEQAIYECDLLVPHTAIPDAVRFMPKNIFEDMVANVYARCMKKEYLPEPQNFVSSIANRMYFYYLYKHYCQKAEAVE